MLHHAAIHATRRFELWRDGLTDAEGREIRTGTSSASSSELRNRTSFASSLV